MKTVPLHGAKAAGRVALVGEGDYETVMRHRWCVTERGRLQPITYALTNIRKPDGTQTMLYMHSLVSGYPRTDHEDHDGLNNCRYNLRDATRSQNAGNSRPYPNASSRYKGVFRDRRRGWWVAAIRNTRLGDFTTEEAAARRYDSAARAAWGEFAWLNFPGSGEHGELAVVAQPVLIPGSQASLLDLEAAS
jgi:hypothetical protein